MSSRPVSSTQGVSGQSIRATQQNILPGKKNEEGRRRKQKTKQTNKQNHLNTLETEEVQILQPKYKKKIEDNFSYTYF